ncbi:glycoside hydrolase family 25 protein [Amycolatopsis sp. NPDC005961]|uniref:glycoside hydrolase family 25 protein n=1 Tax=Amycolatopsis sp. NPDC005961 TaxID=3156720 RepID=UPI0033DE51AC
MAEGIDLYVKYQSVTDWSKVRAAGKTFCYVKVSDGTTAKPTNGWGPAGRAAGLAMGAYHYAQPGDPVAQADLLIAQASANSLTDLGPALDLEAPFVPGVTAANFAIAFLRRIRDRGFLPVLYGSDSMLSYVAPQVRAAVPETWIWVARYGANPKTPWKTWQYSSSGSVPGVTASAVDLNTGSIPFNLETDVALADPDFSYLFYNRPIQEFGNVSQLLAEVVGKSRSAAAGAADAKAAVATVQAAVADVQARVANLQAPTIDLNALAAALAPLVAAAVRADLATAVVDEEARRLAS